MVLVLLAKNLPNGKDGEAMIKMIATFLVIVLALMSIVNTLDSAVGLEETLDSSGASRIVGNIGVKSAVRGVIQGVKDTFDNIFFKSTVNVRQEFRVLTAGINASK